jgi:hypothetical protein
MTGNDVAAGPMCSRNVRGRVVLFLTTVALAFVLLVPQNAVASVTFPDHGTVGGCTYPYSVNGGPVTFAVSTAWAYAFPGHDPEKVYWQGHVQTWTGSSWVNTNVKTGWWAFWSHPKAGFSGDLLGGPGYVGPFKFSLPSGRYYRLASQFYWTSIGLPSNWEYSTYYWCG